MTIKVPPLLIENRTNRNPDRCFGFLSSRRTSELTCYIAIIDLLSPPWYTLFRWSEKGRESGNYDNIKRTDSYSVFDPAQARNQGGNTHKNRGERERNYSQANNAGIRSQPPGKVSR